MTKQIYQIQIALLGFKPKIWRRLLIPSDLLLSNFHKIIQSAMGWTNSHLHQFIKDETFYTARIANDDFWDEMNNSDYSKLKISDLLKTEKEKIIYEYDFGDSWEHEIKLEKILPYDKKNKYPVCIAGRMQCPPEDCGGVWGYADLLEILEQPGHEEYENYKEWFEGGIDPKYFNKDEINVLLREKNYGCFGMY